MIGDSASASKEHWVAKAILVEHRLLRSRLRRDIIFLSTGHGVLLVK